MLNIEPTTVKIPSDFHIAVTSLTDSNGNPLDITNTYIAFKFFIGDKSHYCVSDPMNNQFKNAVIKDGVLYLIFGRHPFRKPGVLMYVQEDRVPNQLYPDGYQNTYSDECESNITLE